MNKSTMEAPIAPTRILVAEDSLTQAMKLRAMLEQHGYEVHTEPNGRAALDAVRRLRPAIVISDVNMPEMNGYQLTRAIKNDRELVSLPVILVTTMSDPQEVMRGLECGADSFILKPYNNELLVGRIQYILLNKEYRKLSGAEMGVEIQFNGQRHYVTAGRMQILDLLLSTYEAAIQRNQELTESRNALERMTDEMLAGSLFMDTVIENIPLAIFIKNADDLRYSRVNRTAEMMTGFTRKDMLHKSDFELFPRNYATEVVDDDLRVLEGRVAGDTPTQKLPTPAGGTRLLHVRKVPINDGTGHTTHLLGIAEDVTDQTAMEQAIRRLNDELADRALELEASNKNLESFAASASHDLRSPLSVVGAYAGLLDKHYGHLLDERGAGYMTAIRKNIRRMGSLIDNLLEFSRWTRKALEVEPVDMNSLVADVVEEQVKALGDDRPVPAVSIGDLPAVNADPALIRQVWINLVSNAVKYSGKSLHPEIVITGRSEGGFNSYSVRDNGVGFSMAEAGRLFVAFERLHGPDDFEGTGVGLVIVHQVVSRHGGRVWAESEEGAGAVFSFTLPHTT